MSRSGRKPKLSAELTDKICRSIRDGNFPSVAARAHGIDDSTFFRWLKAGEDGAVEFNGTPLTPQRHEEFRAFRRAILEAEAWAELLLVGTVRKAAFEITKDAVTGEPIVVIKDWRAAQVMLSTRFRKRWAPDLEDDGEVPAGGAKVVTKKTVVFGARYAPDGQLRVPTLPPPRALGPVQTPAPAGVIDVSQAPPGESRAASETVSEPAPQHRPVLPDV
jgi:hypothetical protein